MQNPFIIGENLYLRPLEEADAPVYVRWLNDPEVSRYLEMGQFPLNLMREQDYIRNLYADQSNMNLGIVLKDDDRHIGSAGLHRIHPANRSATFGIFIGEKDCWEKGYGTEAVRLMLRHGFQTLNLNRVHLRAFEFNVRAVRTYEKAGFVQEGVLRQEHYAEGSYHNVILMGILREDWEKDLC